MPISIDIRYFALLREQRGRESETLTTQATTAAELYLDLAARHGFTLPPDRMKIAINDRFSGLDKKLREGDQVVFVPPVAGG